MKTRKKRFDGFKSFITNTDNIVGILLILAILILFGIGAIQTSNEKKRIFKETNSCIKTGEVLIDKIFKFRAATGRWPNNEIFYKATDFPYWDYTYYGYETATFRISKALSTKSLIYISYTYEPSLQKNGWYLCPKNNKLLDLFSKIWPSSPKDDRFSKFVQESKVAEKWIKKLFRSSDANSKIKSEKRNADYD